MKRDFAAKRKRVASKLLTPPLPPAVTAAGLRTT